MLIRKIHLDDIPEVMALSEEAYDEMGFDDLGYRFDYTHMKQGYAKACNNDGCTAFVAVSGSNKIVGIMFFVISDTTFYFTGRKIASELGWHALPSLRAIRKLKIMRSLLSYAEDELKSQGVKVIYIGTDVRYPTGQHLLDKQGFKPISVYNFKEV